MRVRIKGIHTLRLALADGSIGIYRYAWRGGPRLTGEPGTPEFFASYNAAIATRKQPQPGVLFTLVAAYRASTEFLQLAERTRRDYAKHLKAIETKFGKLPLSGIGDRRVRGVFKAWRDKLALTSPRQADYAWVVLARVLSVAKDRGLIDINPCERGGRIYKADRTESVWTDEHEGAFLEAAPAHLHLALLLALWTGQRQGDLLRLAWSNYDGEFIRLRQSKTGRRVQIPVGAPLKAALDAEREKRRGALMLLTADGARWSADGFRSSWRKACAKAAVAGVTFHDLRGTAVTRLALAGATEAEIATITGLSLADVRHVLDAHYLHRDVALAQTGIARLEARPKQTR